jgi:hypothetical protein
MLGKPLRADRSELEQSGPFSSRRNDSDDKCANGDSDTNQNQHSVTPGFGEGWGRAARETGNAAAVLRKADLKSIR